jgi:uncharacterized membrane protein YphA (DoxX/SURF4 family)
MSVVRRVARPLLAAMFIDGGLDQLRHPATKVSKVGPLLHQYAPKLGLPDDPELLVRANGATMVGAGTLLATGRLPRLSALALAATLVPTTAAGHRFWEVKDPEQRKAQRLHLMKNLSMLGGLLIAAVDTGGRPGLSWRARHAAKDASRTAKHARKDAKRAAKTARREARFARHQVSDALPFD